MSQPPDQDPGNPTFCDLARNEEPTCTAAPVVAVRFTADPRARVEGAPQRWGCEQHAAAALDVVEGARIGSVQDWDACNRLLDLPWNRR